MEASNAGEAFGLLNTLHVDIILCDWMMEPTDGLEFSRLIRNGTDGMDPQTPININVLLPNPEIISPRFVVIGSGGDGLVG